MPESMREKALRAIAEDRVRVIRANPGFLGLIVNASKPDPDTLVRAEYKTYLSLAHSTLTRSCNCRAPGRCYHLVAAEMLWRPGIIDEASSR